MTERTPRDQLDDLYIFRRVALAGVIRGEEIDMSVLAGPVLRECV